MKKFLRFSPVALATLFASLPAMADGGVTDKGYAALGAALAIGIAALGGAIGQGRAAGSALDGISRNPASEPKIFKSMILGLALIESLVIYALVIAFSLVGKA